MVQWFYDRERDTCNQFYFGGCQGNGNRFENKRRCEQRCSSAQPEPPVYEAQPEPQPQPQPEPQPQPQLEPQTQPPPQPQLEPLDICNLPVEAGPCQANKALWYYDPASQHCNAFVYGGCEGNANRFDSEEQCERQCGIFRGQGLFHLTCFYLT